MTDKTSEYNNENEPFNLSEMHINSVDVKHGDLAPTNNACYEPRGKYQNIKKQW